MPQGTATSRLRHLWNEHMRGRSLGESPSNIFVSQEFFNQYKSEVQANVRFTPDPHGPPLVESLVFKSAMVWVCSSLRGEKVVME